MKRKVATDAPADWRPHAGPVEVSDAELQGILDETGLPFNGDRNQVRGALARAKKNYLAGASIQRFPAPARQRKALEKIDFAARRLLVALGYKEHEEKDGNILQSLAPAIKAPLDMARDKLNRDCLNPSHPLSIIEVAVGVATLRDCAQCAHVDAKPHHHDAARSRLIQDLKTIFTQAFDQPARDGGPFHRFAIEAARSLVGLPLTIGAIRIIIRNRSRKKRSRR